MMSAENNWYYTELDEEIGPVKECAIVGMIERGQIKKDTLVKKENMQNCCEAYLSNFDKYFVAQIPDEKDDYQGFDGFASGAKDFMGSSGSLKKRGIIFFHIFWIFGGVWLFSSFRYRNYTPILVIVSLISFFLVIYYFWKVFYSSRQKLSPLAITLLSHVSILNLCWIFGVVYLFSLLLPRDFAVIFVIVSLISSLLVIYYSWKVVYSSRQKLSPLAITLLSLVPIFSLYWNFICYYKLTKKINRGLDLRGIKSYRVSEKLALGYCILSIMLFGIVVYGIIACHLYLDWRTVGVVVAPLCLTMLFKYIVEIMMLKSIVEGVDKL